MNPVDTSTLPPEVMHLRVAIVAMGVTVRELARELEVDSRLVRRWAVGKARMPRIASLAVENLLGRKGVVTGIVIDDT